MAERLIDAPRREWGAAGRLAVPQLLTVGRVALAAAAIAAVDADEPVAAATYITLGAVADGLDGLLARGLGAATPAGALFDYFADYLCFVVAPWLLSRTLLSEALDPAREIMLALPLVTGAVRYARNGALVAAGANDAPDLPGVGTVFCGFLPVVIVFMGRPLASPWTLAAVIPPVTVILALLMVLPVRYPKLTRFAGASPVVLVLLACMPFVATRALASVALVLGLSFVAVAPLWGRTGR